MSFVVDDEKSFWYSRTAGYSRHQGGLAQQTFESRS